MHLPVLRESGRLRRFAAASAAVLAIATLPAAQGATAHAAAAPVDVTVNADEGLGTVPATAYGANQAVWDGNMNAPASAPLLRAANVGMTRYPGGSYGDGYHWQTDTVRVADTSRQAPTSTPSWVRSSPSARRRS
jgi:hypothetical protein